MKRIVSILLLLLILCGCASAQPEPTTEMVELSTTEAAEPSVPAEIATEPPTEPEPKFQVYPLNPGMAYFEYAAPLPDHIYHTLGSDNGLEGTIYVFTGTLTATDTLDAGGYTYDCATVETDGGSIYIMNMYKTICANGGKLLYSDNEDYYIFPEVGETATFLVVYMGYSSVKELPTFILGASADILDIGEYDDPVAAELQTFIHP